MKISIITLFPEVFYPILNSSILKRAQVKKKIQFDLINLRDFGEGRHKVVDARPYGGGAGMILKASVLAKALKSVSSSQLFVNGKRKKAKNDKRANELTILMSASGKTWNQARAKKFSKLNHLILICGHYEGVDQRFIEKYVDEEISIGDYVLTGGEIPTMVIIDSITRLLPGVLEKKEAVAEESFSKYSIQNTIYQLLEYPHFTRPEEFEGKKVPKVLLSGNHKEIKEWRKQQSFKKTKKMRPDLLERI